MRPESQALCLGTAETTVAGISYWPAWNGCLGLQKLQSFKQVTVVMWLVTMRGCRGLAVAQLAKGPPFPPSSISWGTVQGTAGQGCCLAGPDPTTSIPLQA